ncbi:serine/threonine-protein kinase [Actinokineospora bangkokensis]|uniref:non-specific serine/threonine protein kinase n=1 Tax=Actinokineospora bangkokensis TaxID=1193682 RepID=A0A1Q9LIM7_9PSEU|nr:serine/threonine-protein kinase [Actinokineospora bangkokensis]OLR91907.1 hypothetical protein BJP25_24050 [Actinokineospora bangkokensis]
MEVPDIPGMRVHGEIGGSGTNVVYLAEDRLLGRRVVVKTLRRGVADDPRVRERFLSTTRMAAGLDHPHVTRVLSAGLLGGPGGPPYAVYQHVHGSDMQHVLDEEGPLRPARIADVVDQLASALDHVHAWGLVHRDVTPRNVLVAPRANGHCYLSDFGIALEARVPGSSDQPRPERSAGSPGYAAPEQLAGLPTDHRADVHSLGALVLVCATGVQPWRLAEEPGLREWVRARLPGDGEVLAGVLDRAMHRDPAARYSTCQELATAVRAWAGAPPR